MKLSLYQRLSLALLVVFLFILSAMVFWSLHLTKNTRYESEQKLHLSLAANLARDNPLLQQGVYDHAALKNLFHTLMVLGPAFEFYFVSPTGEILTHSIIPTKIKRQKISVKPILDLIQNLAPLPVYGDDPQDLSNKKIFSAAPVINDAKLQGYLYVIVTGQQYESIFNRQQAGETLEISLLIMAAALLFLFIVTLVIFRVFTVPLRTLNKEMMALEKVGFNNKECHITHWKHSGHNEVHQLGSTFEKMVVQINEQLAQLKTSDKKRREILTDISHDLRTPLSSLQGYIETLALKGEQVEQVQRQAFIDTAFKNCQQLNKLIDQIFELAHLESGQVSLTLENFNLTELLYDVLAKFTLKAQQKNINLTIVPNCENAMVYSDIAKLERILSNLIDNAIRHTPKGGKITLSMTEGENSGCKVTVKDNGSGIKANELAYIFDTRYRASNATESKGIHCGFGLAITKKLLEILHSDIRVTSELGKGSAFYFQLPSIEVQ
ncbi:MAG: sensor histidine kinase [Thalassotalea sp.]